MTTPPLDVEASMRGLKDFQRRTVDYVFNRMYRDSARRFLVADEVGLGKTLVARGIIAKAVQHLQQTGVDRIDDALHLLKRDYRAQQNLNRLNVTDQETSSFATRLTFVAATASKPEVQRYQLHQLHARNNLRSTLTGRKEWRNGR